METPQLPLADNRGKDKRAQARGHALEDPSEGYVLWGAQGLTIHQTIGFVLLRGHPQSLSVALPRQPGLTVEEAVTELGL